MLKKLHRRRRHAHGRRLRRHGRRDGQGRSRHGDQRAVVVGRLQDRRHRLRRRPDPERRRPAVQALRRRASPSPINAASPNKDLAVELHRELHPHRRRPRRLERQRASSARSPTSPPAKRSRPIPTSRPPSPTPRSACRCRPTRRWARSGRPWARRSATSPAARQDVKTALDDAAKRILGRVIAATARPGQVRLRPRPSDIAGEGTMTDIALRGGAGRPCRAVSFKLARRSRSSLSITRRPASTSSGPSTSLGQPMLAVLILALARRLRRHLRLSAASTRRASSSPASSRSCSSSCSRSSTRSTSASRTTPRSTC